MYPSRREQKGAVTLPLTNCVRGDEAVADYDAALEHFLELCAQASPAQCLIAHDGLTGEELLEEQWSFYQDLVAGKFTASDAQGNKIDFSDFQGIMQQVIFQWPRLWAKWTNKWAYVYNNRTAVPATQRRATPPFDPTTAGPIADTESQILTAITCGDADRFSDVSGAKFKEWQAIYNNRSQYGGETMSPILFACSTWLVDAKEKAPSFEGVVTKTPVLFVEGLYDPVTPSESARNSSAGFVGSGIQWHTGIGVRYTSARRLRTLLTSPFLALFHPRSLQTSLPNHQSISRHRSDSRY